MSEYRDLRDAVWARAWEGGLTTPELVVLLRLVEHWPRVFPGQIALARWTAQSERTVRDALSSLESKRILRIVRNPGRGNVYQFIDQDGNPMTTRGLGPTPAGAAGPPRQELPVTPAGAAGPTPAGAAAEADPDLKQTTKQTMEAGTPGARPVPKFEFDPKWKPKEEHRRWGKEHGLTEAEMLERAEECRLKLYEHAFKTEDKQFSRELIWLVRDKETRKFKESRKANPHGLNENPGRGRQPGDSHESVFGRIASR